MAWLKRATFYLSGGLCLLLALLFVLLGWLAFTEAGARFALQRALPLAPVSVQYYELTGNLWAGLRLGQISVQASDSALGFEQISASHLAFRWQPLGLLSGRVLLEQLTVADLTVQLSASQADDDPLVLPQMDLPVQIHIKRLASLGIHVISPEGEWHIPHFRAHLVAGGDKVIVSNLRLRHEDVDYRLSARARLRETLEFDAALKSHGVKTEGHCQGGAALVCRASLHWQNFSHPLTDDFQSPNGALTLNLKDSVLHLTGDADFAWPFAQAPIDTRIALTGELDLTRATARLDSLAGEFAEGKVQASGTFDWSQHFSMALDVRAEQLSLAHWLPQALAESRANLTSSLVLSVPPAGLDLRWSLAQLHLNFGARPLVGSAEFYVQPAGMGLRAVTLRGESGQLLGDAYYGADEQLSVSAQLNASNLTTMVPELAGAADVSLALAGKLAAPTVQLTVAGRHLALADWQLDGLVLAADVAADAPDSASLAGRVAGVHVRDFTLAATGLARAGQALGSVQLRAQGDAAAHTIAVTGQDLLGQLSLRELTLQGRLELPAAAENFDQLLVGGRWLPKLTALTFTDGFHEPAWSLVKSSRAQLSSTSLHWPALCLAQASARLCWDALQLNHWQDLQASGRIYGFYLDRERSLYPAFYDSLPLGWQLRGEAKADWQVALKSTAGSLSAVKLDVAFGLTGAGLRYQESGETALDLPVQKFRLRLVGDEKLVDAHGVIELAEQQQIRLVASARQWLGADRELGASLSGQLDQLGYLQPFFPSVQALAGRLDMDLAVRLPKGRTEPVYDGRLLASDVSLLVPAAGTQVADWRLLLEAEGGNLHVSGGGKLGDGDATVAGTVMPPGPSTSAGRLFDAKLRIAGTGLTLVNLPDIQLRASPDLTLQGNGRDWHLAGAVRVEDSSWVLRELPEAAVEVSEDARVYGADLPPPQRSLLNLTSDVTLRLGKRVNFEGFGLTTSVAGSLRYSRDESRVNQVQGVLSLPKGRFRSYGQKLDINDGRIIFSGPVDNPALDVRAARKIEDVEAGIWLTGTAKYPKTELYSSPPMSEADILAYIVSGKPISESGQGDVVDMQSAALSLGLKQALPLLQRIGGQFGLSDISIEETSRGGSSIAAGKRLSDKLYVKYVYGLLGAAGNFVVQYKLTDQLTLETSSGETQAIDVTYRWDSKPPTPAQAAAELATPVN